jgi:hypothetical protein
LPSVYGQRRAHLNPAEGRKLHEVLRDVSPDEAEEFKENVLSPAEIERRKHRKATPTPVRSEVPMSDTNLRASLIRLAHANPSLRADILPLVMKEAGTYKEYVDRKRKKGEKPMSEDAWRARTEGGGKAKTEEKKPEGGEKAEGGSKPKSPIPAKMYEYIGPDAVQIGDAIKAGKPIPKEEAERVIDLLEGVFDKAKAGKAIVPPSIMKHYKSLHKFLKAEGGSKSEKPGQPPAEGKKPKSFKKNYRPKMESVMKKHELTDDDGAQIIEFSLARPKKGKPQSPAELMRRFMQNAKPETKARMKNMSPADFMIMLRAVLDQEEGGAKAASLRTAAIRFAYENPALRKVILAALKEADEGSPEADKGALKEDADPASHDQNLASTWEKTAAGPDAMGRGWKEKDDGGKHRWVWAGRSGEPAFTVTEQSTPVGLIYKLQILMPEGNIFQTFGQKTEKEHWFKRAAQLYKEWSSGAVFDLIGQPEKWSRLASGPKVAADHDYSPERGEVGGVRDDLIAALKKNGIQAEDDVSSNVLYIGDAKYAIHGPWLEGKGLGGRGKWIQKPTRAAWLAEAVKVLSKLAKK